MISDVPHFHRATRIAGLFAPAIVDVFAGLGGWSIGEEAALVEAGFDDRYIDLMINHWATAVGVHQVNHPLTHHMHASVLEVDPDKVLLGRPIVHAHFSPDCTDHSKAKGGKPRRKEIRALADVVIIWAAKRRPTVITLENVEEFQQWGPLLTRGPRKGHPDPDRRGQEFARWVGELRGVGYAVEWRELRACDYGAPTTRKRLFVIARCDGRPIVWPEKTHGNNIGGNGEGRDGRQDGEGAAHRQGIHPRHRGGLGISGAVRGSSASREELSDRTGNPGKRPAVALKPYRTAAECIDWRTPMLSIFATRPQARAWAARQNVGREKHDRIGVPQRPLKRNTQKRLAGGLLKWVLNAERPFLVNIQNSTWGPGDFPVDRPMPTVTATPKGGAFAAADVELSGYVARTDMHSSNSGCNFDAEKPLTTITTAAGHAAVGASVSPIIVGAGGAAYAGKPVPADRPLNTIMTNDRRGVEAVELTAFTVPRYGEREGQAPRSGSIEKPLPAVTGTDNGAQLAAVAIAKNCGGPNGHITYGQPIDRPLDTITSKCQHGAIAVHLTQYHNDGTVRGQDPREPVKTLDTQNRFGAVGAWLVRMNQTDNGMSAAGPLRTVINTEHHGVAAAYLSHLYSSSAVGGQGDPEVPIKSITAQGNHAASVIVYLSPYYGSESAEAGHSPAEPMPTVTGKARFGLVGVESTRHWVLTPAALKRARQVATWARKMLGKKVAKYLLSVADEASGKVFQLLTCTVRGAIHLVTDVLMRMLRPRELARAQGFDDAYVIDRTADGERVSKADQVKLIGNSVPPAFSRAICRDNVVPLLGDREATKGRWREAVVA